jgi:hypothetical protein
MARKKQEGTAEPGATADKEQPLPGLGLEHFKAAINAIKILVIDSAKFLMFLSRPGRVRLIGDLDTFSKAFAQQLKQDQVESSVAQEALEEVANFLQLCVALPSTKGRVRFLEEQVFEDWSKSNGADLPNFRNLLEEKIKYVENQPFLKRLSRRRERLSTAVGPCLEDMDVELISERQDQFIDQAVKQPFLRMRLRYSVVGEIGFPFEWHLLKEVDLP